MYTYLSTIVFGKMLFTNKSCPTLIARSGFVINKCRWLKLIVNLVSVVLTVGADGCMQGTQGANPLITEE